MFSLAVIVVGAVKRALFLYFVMLLMQLTATHLLSVLLSSDRQYLLDHHQPQWQGGSPPQRMALLVLAQTPPQQVIRHAPFTCSQDTISNPLQIENASKVSFENCHCLYAVTIMQVPHNSEMQFLSSSMKQLTINFVPNIPKENISLLISKSHFTEGLLQDKPRFHLDGFCRNCTIVFHSTIVHLPHQVTSKYPFYAVSIESGCYNCSFSFQDNIVQPAVNQSTLSSSSFEVVNSWKGLSLGVNFNYVRAFYTSSFCRYCSLVFRGNQIMVYSPSLLSYRWQQEQQLPLALNRSSFDFDQSYTAILLKGKWVGGTFDFELGKNMTIVGDIRLNPLWYNIYQEIGMMEIKRMEVSSFGWLGTELEMIFTSNVILPSSGDVSDVTIDHSKKHNEFFHQSSSSPPFWMVRKINVDCIQNLTLRNVNITDLVSVEGRKKHVLVENNYFVGGRFQVYFGGPASKGSTLIIQQTVFTLEKNQFGGFHALEILGSSSSQQKTSNVTAMVKNNVFLQPYKDYSAIFFAGYYVDSTFVLEENQITVPWVTLVNQQTNPVGAISFFRTVVNTQIKAATIEIIIRKNDIFRSPEAKNVENMTVGSGATTYITGHGILFNSPRTFHAAWAPQFSNSRILLTSNNIDVHPTRDMAIFFSAEAYSLKNHVSFILSEDDVGGEREGKGGIQITGSIYIVQLLEAHSDPWRFILQPSSSSSDRWYGGFLTVKYVGTFTPDSIISLFGTGGGSSVGRESIFQATEAIITKNLPTVVIRGPIRTNELSSTPLLPSLSRKIIIENVDRFALENYHLKEELTVTPNLLNAAILIRHSLLSQMIVTFAHSQRQRNVTILIYRNNFTLPLTGRKLHRFYLRGGQKAHDCSISMERNNFLVPKNYITNINTVMSASAILLGGTVRLTNTTLMIRENYFFQNQSLSAEERGHGIATEFIASWTAMYDGYFGILHNVILLGPSAYALHLKHLMCSNTIIDIVFDAPVTIGGIVIQTQLPVEGKGSRFTFIGYWSGASFDISSFRLDSSMCSTLPNQVDIQNWASLSLEDQRNSQQPLLITTAPVQVNYLDIVAPTVTATFKIRELQVVRLRGYNVTSTVTLDRNQFFVSLQDNTIVTGRLTITLPERESTTILRNNTLRSLTVNAQGSFHYQDTDRFFNVSVIIEENRFPIFRDTSPPMIILGSGTLQFTKRGLLILRQNSIRLPRQSSVYRKTRAIDFAAMLVNFSVFIVENDFYYLRADLTQAPTQGIVMGLVNTVPALKSCQLIIWNNTFNSSEGGIALRLIKIESTRIFLDISYRTIGTILIEGTALMYPTNKIFGLFHDVPPPRSSEMISLWGKNRTKWVSVISPGYLRYLDAQFWENVSQGLSSNMMIEKANVEREMVAANDQVTLVLQSLGDNPSSSTFILPDALNTQTPSQQETNCAPFFYQAWNFAVLSEAAAAAKPVPTVEEAVKILFGNLLLPQAPDPAPSLATVTETQKEQEADPQVITETVTLGTNDDEAKTNTIVQRSTSQADVSQETTTVPIIAEEEMRRTLTLLTTSHSRQLEPSGTLLSWVGSVNETITDLANNSNQDTPLPHKKAATPPLIDIEIAAASPAEEKAITSAASTTAIASAVVGGGAAAAAEIQTLAVMGWISCANDNVQSATKGTQWMLTPLQLGTGTHAYLLGSLVLVCGVILLHGVVASLLHKAQSSKTEAETSAPLSTKNKDQNQQGEVSNIPRAFGQVWFPSKSIYLWNFALTGISLETFRIFQAPSTEDGKTTASMVVGSGACLLILLVSSTGYWIFRKKVLPFATYHPYKYAPAFVRPQFCRFFLPQGYWASGTVKSSFSTMINSYKGKEFTIFCLLPTLRAITTALIASFRATTASGCKAQFFCLGALAWSYALVLIIFRPSRHFLPQMLSIFTNFLLGVVTAAPAIPSLGNQTNHLIVAMSAASTFSICCSVFISVFEKFWLSKKELKAISEKGGSSQEMEATNEQQNQQLHSALLSSVPTAHSEEEAEMREMILPVDSTSYNPLNQQHQ